MSCNYATFVYVLNAAEGDLAAAVRTIRELAAIPCIGVLVPGVIAVDGKERSVRREVQSAAMPPMTVWPQVSRLTADLLAPLARLPEDWRDHEPAGSPTTFIYGDKG